MHVARSEEAHFMCRLMKNIFRSRVARRLRPFRLCWWATSATRRRGPGRSPPPPGRLSRSGALRYLNTDFNYQLFKEMWKCTYIETSAKNNFNIEAVFQEILTLEQKRQLSFQVDDDKVNSYYSKNQFIS